MIIWSDLALGTGLENLLSVTVIFLLSLGSVFWLKTVLDESRLMLRARRKDREGPLLRGSFPGSCFPRRRDDAGGASAALAKAAACWGGSRPPVLVPLPLLRETEGTLRFAP